MEKEIILVASEHSVRTMRFDFDSSRYEKVSRMQEEVGMPKFALIV
jgi:hypothetical protein